MQEGMRDTVPLWLASAITVVVSLPFGLWLGNYSLPLWVAFIVWAEYFTLGATPSVLRIIVPAYLLGVSGATLLLVAYTLTARAAGDAQLLVANDLAMIVAFFVCFCVLVYAMRFARVTQVGTLPFFNGISMLLGVYFTHSYVAAAGLAYDAATYATSLEMPVIAGVGAALAGLLGAFLGWFNVLIMIRRPAVPAAVATARRA